MSRLLLRAATAALVVSSTIVIPSTAAVATSVAPINCISTTKTVVDGWGEDTNGQVGAGVDGPPILFPIPVTGSASTMHAVAAGQWDSAAITNCGGVVAWGNNDDGQLGTDYPNEHDAPVSVPRLANIVKVAVGQSFMLALDSHGSVWAWGANGSGNIGIGTTSPSDVTFAVQVTGLANIVDISAGGIGAAVDSSGRVWTWGPNDLGELGNGHVGGIRTTPALVPGLTGIAHVSVGAAHILALRPDGTVFAWGANDQGQIGNATLVTQPSPVQLPSFCTVTQVAAGFADSVALCADGTVQTWGLNGVQELGRPAGAYSTVPGTVPGLSGVTQVAAGWISDFARKADGTVWCWGDNSYGELGLDTGQQTYASPVQNQTLSGVSQIAAGSTHALALRTMPR